MKSLKIVVIGAGSASFGLNTLAHLVSCEKLHGSHLALVDLDREGLALMKRLAERMSAEWGARMTMSATTQRERALPGADFVILSVARDRENRWKLDGDVPEKYGIIHYAENSGPGGVAHTARSVHIVLPILRDMEKLCPNAWVLNFTNPVPRIALLAHRYTCMKMVGICHQISFAYIPVGCALAKELGVPFPKGFRPSLSSEVLPLMEPMTHRARDLVDIKAAGTNHNTWILDLRHKKTGRDLYPVFARNIRKFPRDWQPVSRKLFDLFGIYPATGDGHLAEYLPWFSDAKSGAWARYGLHLYNFTAAKRGRSNMWRRIKRMVAGAEPIDSLRDLPSERAAEIITGIAFDENSYELAVNVPNEGYIANLPDDVIVEVPGVVSSFGVRGMAVGNLPPPVAEICRRELTGASLAVDAIVHRSRKLAIQAVLFCPGVGDIDTAGKIVDDYLKVHRSFLPHFH